MAVLKLHGYRSSTAVMRVLACLYEKELDYQFVDVDMLGGEHKREPFLKLNPFGQIPAFEDGDLKLFESRAITRYIADEYAQRGTPLLYEGTKAMAYVNVGLEIEAHQFDPPASKLTWELVNKSLFSMTTDPKAVEEHEAKLSKVLDVYETRLAQSKYLAGDEFSLVDLHHLPNLHSLKSTTTNKLFESRPHVCAWRDSILARPSWMRVAEIVKQAVEALALLNINLSNQS